MKTGKTRALVVLSAISKETTLTADYPKELTAAVLRKIGLTSPELSQNIHDGKEGYFYGKRIYKPLIHSQLQGVVWDKRRQAYLIPGGYCLFYVGWRDDVVNAFIRGVENEPVFRLGAVEMKAVSATKTTLIHAGNEFTTLSPVVVTRDGRSVLYRDAPKEFCSLAEDNLRRKYHAIYGREYTGPLSLQVSSKMRAVPVYWGSAVVLGNVGRLIIKGTKEIIDLAHVTGLGRRNALGFGMLEAV